MLVHNGLKYTEWTPQNEEQEFHPIVRKLSNEIFGKDTIYFDVKTTIRSAAGIGSIPDAYVIDLAKLEWYVIENELSSHPIYDHIVKQLTKFINGLENQQSKNTILELLYQEINKDSNLRTSVLAKTKSLDLYRFLTKLLSKYPKIVVTIDKLTADLEEACGALRYQPNIIEIRTFSEDANPGNQIHLFEPLYQEEPSGTNRLVITKPQNNQDVLEQKTGWIDLIKESNDKVKTISMALIAKIELLPNVTHRPSGKNYIFNKGGSSSIGRFTAFMPRRQELAIRLRTDASNYPDTQGLIRDKTYNWFFHNGHGVERELKISEIEQVNYVFELIKRSYEIAELKGPPPSYQTYVPDDELLELTPENFLSVAKRLGGVDVTTAQMLKYFKIIHAEGKRYGKLRDVAYKLAEEKRITLVKDDDERVWKITLR